MIQPKPKNVENQKQSCDYCNFTTSSKCNLTKHIKRKHKDRSINPELVCKLCQEEFSDRYRREQNFTHPII